MKALVPAALLLLSAAPAPALDIPRIDYRRTCRDTPPVTTDKKGTFDQCMADEKQARDQLPGAWRSASARVREQCAALTRLGGQSSYVELITCLEMENPGATAAPKAGAASLPGSKPQAPGAARATPSEQQ